MPIIFACRIVERRSKIENQNWKVNRAARLEVFPRIESPQILLLLSQSDASDTFFATSVMDYTIKIKAFSIFLTAILILSCHRKSETILGIELKDNLTDCSRIEVNYASDTIITHPSNRFSIKLPKNWPYFIDILDSVVGINCTDPNPIIDANTGKFKYLRSIGVTEIEAKDSISLENQFQNEVLDFIVSYPNVEILSAGYGSISNKKCIWTRYQDSTDQLGNLQSMNYMFRYNNTFYIVETSIYGDSVVDRDFCELRKYVSSLVVN